jgi:dTDP-6-deoxy-L-talose 4-dehydrogenase (NAD+)
MKVAVTGATGFVGRYVVAELERRNVSPTLVCHPSEAAVLAASPHRTVAIDIRDAPADAFARLDRPDVLVHLAWGGLPQYRSAHHFTVEAPAHFQFLRGLVDAGLTHLLAAGTCYEYGMQSGALREDLEARPVTAYGFGKDMLRRQLEFLAPYTGATLTWARLFYPYGDGQAPNSLWPSLKKAVADGAATFDMSKGDQLRDYLHIEEVARHLVSLALAEREFGIVNICSGSPISIRALVERWLAENGWSIELNLGRYPYPDYEPLEFWGDAGKLQRSLCEASTSDVRRTG